MASNNQSIRQLADAIFDIDRRLTGVERTPQLGNSSLEDTGINVYDSENNLTVTVGKQPDGTFGATPVRGPVPPAPEGIDAEGDAGVIRASWAGTFRDGAAKPMDFAAVEVLVDGVVLGALHDPLGGSVTVPAISGEREVSFRTLSQAGKHSEAVGHVTVTVEPRVSAQMLELGEDLAELNDVVLPELADELDAARTDLQQKLDAANQRIDDIVIDGGGGAGNFTTYSVNEPSGEGTGSGDQWFRVVNGEVLGQWQWDGETWAPVTLTDAVIAGIDLSKIVSNGNLSEVVASKMFTDIFTANKITSQEIAAGSITTEKISSEGIIADVIQGGSFVGETFEGGEFVGGAFRTSEAEPGEVLLSDTAFRDPTTNADGPGMRITPQLFEGYDVMPSIGPTADSMVINGGKSISGGQTVTTINPDGSTTVHTNGDKSSSSSVTSDGANFFYRGSDGKDSGVEIRSGHASVSTEDNVEGKYGSILAEDGVVHLRSTKKISGRIDQRSSLELTAGSLNVDSYSRQGTSNMAASPSSTYLQHSSSSGGITSIISASGSEARMWINDSASNMSSSVSATLEDITLTLRDTTTFQTSQIDIDKYSVSLNLGGSVFDTKITANNNGIAEMTGRGGGGEGRIEAGPERAVMRSRVGNISSSVEATADSLQLRRRRDATPINLGTVATGLDLTSSGIDIYSTDTNNVRRGQVQVTDNGVASILASDGTTSRGLEVNNSGVWAKNGSESVSLIPQVRPFQYSAQWNADQSPAPIMVQHLPGGKLCQAQIRIQNLSGSPLALPYDTWVTVNYNPIPTDLRGGYTDYIEVTLPQLNARGRVEMSYSTGRIRIKSLEKDTTIAWTNNNSIWFPMRWFSPDSASL